MGQFAPQQELLLAWMKSYGSRSYAQIRAACSSLAASFSIQLKSPWFSLFYPVLKNGVVEYCGKEQYALSAPVALYCSATGRVAGVNLPDELLATIEHKCGGINKSGPGIHTFYCNESLLGEICARQEIILQDVGIARALAVIPPVSSVISSYPVVDPPEHKYFFNHLCHTWVPTKWPEMEGLYKTSEEPFAQRVFYYGHKYFRLPSPADNPDAFAIAEVFHTGLQGGTIFEYNAASQELAHVNRMVNTPLLIHRLLLVASICDYRATGYSNGPVIYSGTSGAVVKKLNQILCNTISII